MQPGLRTLGRRAVTRTEEHSGFNLLQAAVLEGSGDIVTKASVHLENFVEEMNCRTTGLKASIFPGKSAADILAASKWSRKSHPLIGEIYEEFVETEKRLTQLHSCAKSNDLELAIELVLNYGMDVNVAAKRNITPLVWASSAASSLSIKTLIDLGAEVNAQTFQESAFGFCSGTALRSAIHGNNANVVKVLLANKADANIVDLQKNTVLHSSISKGLFNISQLLIDSGCEVNWRNNRGETSLHSAVLGKNAAVVELVLRNNADANIQDDNGNTPLHISTREGLCDISQSLVGSGCEINMRNNRGKTSLHSAVLGKNVAVVELLLRNKADANIQDDEGNTLLHISTREGLCDISLLLVGYGCKINVRNNRGETSLHSAVHGKNVAVVEFLLKNNAAANVKDAEGNTPLHISTRRGFSNISKLLIHSGCNKHLKNREGMTPLDIEIYRFSNPFFRGDSEEAEGNEGYTYAPRRGFRRESFSERRYDLFSSGDEDDLWMNQPALPPLSSPVVSKPKEQKSIEGSGILLEKRQALISSKEPDLVVPRKLERTKGGTSRVEKRSTNRSRCEVM